MFRRALQSIALAAPATATPATSALNLVPAALRMQIPASSASRRFLVELGEMEQGLLDMSIRASAASFIFIKIELDAAVNASVVEQTLSKMQAVYPMLRCRVTRNEGKFVYEHHPGTRIPVQVRDPRMESCADIFANEMQRTQIKLGTSPHRVLVLGNSIVFALEHFAFDGGSLVHFLDRFFKVYSSGGDNVKSAALPVEPWRVPSCVAIRNTLKMGDLALKFRMAREVKQIVEATVQARVGRLPRTDFSKQFTDAEMPNFSQTAQYTHTLAADEVKEFQLACRRHGCTITTAVTEAYSRAFGERIESKRDGGKNGPAFSCSAAVVTDIRHLLEPNIPASTTSPYLGATQVFTDKISNWEALEADWALAKKINSNLKASSANVESTLVRSLFNMLLTPYLPTSKFLPTFAISSWGAKSPLKDEYGKTVRIKDLEVFQNYNFFMAPSLSVYPCGGGNRLRITMFATIPFHDERDLEWISSRAKEILRRMIGK